MTDGSNAVGNPSRRKILATGVAACAGILVSRAAFGNTARAAAEHASTTPVPGPFKLQALPYAESALAPRISAETVALHYGKHHRGYVEKLNTLLARDPRRGKSLEDLMRSTRKSPDDTAIYNNAAQIFNHEFYWRSMTPNGGGVPTGAIGKAIARDFGDFAALRAKLAEAAVGQFGSGWAWLVVRDGKLSVRKTDNAENPLLEGARPLLTIDVWEHSYYVDYRNRRADYVSAVIDGLLNWQFAEANLAA